MEVNITVFNIIVHGIILKVLTNSISISITYRYLKYFSLDERDFFVILKNNSYTI